MAKDKDPYDVLGLSDGHNNNDYDEWEGTKADELYLEEELSVADELLLAIEGAGNKINKEEAAALEELYGDLSIETIETLVPGVEFSDGANRIFSSIPDAEVVEAEQSYDYDTNPQYIDDLYAEIEAEVAGRMAEDDQYIADLEGQLAEATAELEDRIQSDTEAALELSVASSNAAREEEGVSGLLIEDVGETSTDGGTTSFKSRDTQYNVTPYTGLSTISSGMVNV